MADNKTKEFLIYFSIIFILLFLIIVFIVSYPFIYNWILGEAKIDEHIQEILGNKTEHKEVVPILLNYVHENIYYPSKEEEVLTLSNGFGFYYINKSIRFFHRGVPASWVIKSGLGRCGEDAQYFMEVMEKLGYKTRKIIPEGWDHAWTEYYTAEGYRILVDPSSNQIIENSKEWGNNSNWTKIEASDMDGNKEDVSEEYR